MGRGNYWKLFRGTARHGISCVIGMEVTVRRFVKVATRLGIREVLTAPQSLWQKAYIERLIGSIRRECLDHVVILNEASLRRVLNSYFKYYERTRTHLSLGRDAPISRPAQGPSMGRIVKVHYVGGLHHRYERVAA
jgi:putative transposase